MTRYAEKTDVPSDRSRAEIERTTRRYGAVGFMYGWENGFALVAFRTHDRMVRFVLPIPDPDHPGFAETPTGKARAPAAAERAYEQAVKQRWRALALCIKAKLEAVEAGITSFDDEFLAHLVLPDGQRVGDWVQPQIEQAYLTGEMPKLLLAGRRGRAWTKSTSVKAERE